MLPYSVRVEEKLQQAAFPMLIWQDNPVSIYCGLIPEEN